MKAVLEFNYPEDTEKCRRAIHADEAFDTLWEVRKVARLHYQTRADVDRALRHIFDMVEDALKSVEEAIKKKRETKPRDTVLLPERIILY